jgi:hypothetical protein
MRERCAGCDKLQSPPEAERAAIGAQEDPDHGELIFSTVAEAAKALGQKIELSIGEPDGGHNSWAISPFCRLTIPYQGMPRLLRQSSP